MKTKTSMLLAAILMSASIISAQESRSTSRNSATTRLATRGDRGRVFDEEKQYIVFKLYTDKEPITEKEKKELQYVKQQLAGKNVQVIEFKYSSKEDLEKLFKDNGIEDVTVSTENGIFLKSKNSNYNTTSSKAAFIFEGKAPDVPKRPIVLCSGECENSLKMFFKLRSFS